MFSPPPADVVRLVGPALDDYLQRLRGLYYAVNLGTCNSWWRSVAHNLATEGADPCSQHLYGLASDWQTNERTELAIALAPQFGLVAVPTGTGRTAVHVQYYPSGTLRSLGACPTLA
jgi:hypothetical protein